ncbi:FAD-dependent oxidoreductase [Streptomyces desertarenae]|uniref:FAD-dependent oxidoreductase n=1 Tax=Streptomyces desertarenae TaxID=2666184 RepID=A0ABW4PKC2_9ACTN
MGAAERIHDLAVIGTGIIGATAVALAAARRPDASLLAVCSGTAHDGSTDLSLAVDIPAGRTAEQRSLAARSLRLSTLLEQVAPALRGRRVPTYWLVPEDGVAAADGQLVGDRLTPCDPGEKARLAEPFGPLPAAPGTVLLRSAPARVVEPAAAVRQLLAPLTGRPGNALVEGFTVRAVLPCPDGWRLVAEDGGELRARKVLAAPGAWALHGPFARTARRHGARTKKIVAYRLRATPPGRGTEPAGPRPLLVVDEPDAFLLPAAGGGTDWWCSITSTHWDCPPGRTELYATGPDRAELDAVRGDHLPGFRGDVVGGRVGADVYAPDFRPLTVPLDGRNDAVLATGGAGSGFRLAPAIADRALDLLDFR